MAYAWLLLVSAAVLVECYPQTQPPFASLKAPAETIRNYEVHTPVVLNEYWTEGQLLSFDLQVSRHLVHLELNRDLIPPQFTSHHYEEDGTTIQKKGHVNCFYHGGVSGHPEWHVAMSTCHGVQGSFGDLGNAQKYYHLEPLNLTNPSIHQLHAVYTSAEYTKQEATCGVTDHHLPQHPAIPEGFHVDTHRVRRLVNGFYIVEWAMINDFTQYDNNGRDLEATVMRALEIANVVDSLFRPLMVRVVVVHMITWSTGDRIPYPPDGDSGVLLDNLRDFEPQIMPVHDSTMLITGVDLDGNTVGKAFVGTMCQGQSSVGLSQDTQRSVDSVASTAAHELGHVFSLNHDENGCSCTDPAGTCIMAAVSGGTPPTIWSSCSQTEIANAFTRDNLERCLGNAPLVTVGDPVCGNGIRERDEICDCGTPQECTDPCCNATSCMLNAGAQCSNGDCCSPQCQYHPRGTICRAETQQCDITEFCTGESSSCPEDTYFQDGALCNSGSDFCYNGFCRSVDSQCQRFFNSMGASSQCLQLNTDGDTGGNCGFSGSSFQACEPENVACGSLQCERGTFVRGDVGGFLRISTSTIGSTVCMAFSSLPSSDTNNPGLVADGTRCGNASICLFQECVPLSSLTGIQACPNGPNGEVCSGAGVCNNLNQCSCNDGNPDPTCDPSSAQGAGGAGGGGNGGVIAGAVVGVILGIGLAVAVIVGVVFIGRKVCSSKHDKSYLPPAKRNTTVDNHVASTGATSAPFVAYRPQVQSSPKAPPTRVPPARPSTTPTTPRTGQAAPQNRNKPSTPRTAPLSKPSYPPPTKPNPLAKPNPPPPAKPAAPPAPKPRPGRIQQQWPPPSDSEKPAPPKKPVFPPRR